MASNSNASLARGACLCGGVSFTAGLPPKWVAHCHCTRCRRAHGAAFVTWVSVGSAQVELDDPAELLRWYEAPEGGSRGFCSRCGSPTFFKAPAWPGELHIARALFIDPVGREPQVHAYFDTHVDWVKLGDHLPRKPAPG
jgi:hypothetical protein